MKKVLLLTTKVVVEDMTKEQLREEAKIAGMPVRDLMTLKDAIPFDIGVLISDFIGNEDGDAAQEIFAGSMMYARITGSELVRAEWEADHD